MLWILIFVGDGLQPSLQLIQMSRVGFLVMGKPWSTHGNPCLSVLYGTVSVGSHDLQVTLHWLLFLGLLV